MTQYTLVQIWHHAGETPTHIHEKLVDTFGEYAISLSTVSRTIRKLSWTTNTNTEKVDVGRPPDQHNMRIIQQIIYDNPMISCHQISREADIPYTTVRYALIHHLKYKCRKLHWVPHYLSDPQKKQRVECCKQILTILQNQKRLHWRYIITGDESWFTYHTQYGYQWIPEDEEAQEDIKISNMSPKILVIQFWNPNGIAILKVLPAGQTLNGDTFLQSIIEPLCEYPQFKEAKKSRKKILYSFR